MKNDNESNLRPPFVDFQQMEFRLLAHLAEDETLIGLFNDPKLEDVFILLTAEWCVVWGATREIGFHGTTKGNDTNIAG